MLRKDPPYPDERMAAPFHTYRAQIDEVLDAQTLDVVVDCGFGIHNHTRIEVFGIECDEPDPDDPDSDGRLQALRTSSWVRDATTSFDGDWPFAIKTLASETAVSGEYRAEVYRRDTTAGLREWLLQEFPEMAR